ncbi:MAG: glycosyl hydrolase family 28-related protein [Acidobacteriaceae bacterium]|nr:glycosyl hydrolase family 28-related protein [Acidobacteriaceae bacterium]
MLSWSFPIVRRVGTLCLLLVCVFAARAEATLQQALDASTFPLRPQDPAAATFTGRSGEDVSAELQATIDKLQETRHQGVIFIPEGRYRLTRTIYVWTGIRLIGFGAKRPVFLLPDNTSGFSGDTPVALFHFAHQRPRAGQPIQDGTSDTFYSGLFNIDIQVGKGNPAASAVRFHVAQHGILSHLRIEMRSGHAAIWDAGNIAEDLHLIGGDYAIDTGVTAPAWPWVLMDSVLEDQQKAAVRTHDAGTTLVRVQILHTPIAVEIPAGKIEHLYLADTTLQAISGVAIQPGDAANERSQIAADNLRCIGVPHFLPGTSLSAALPGLPGSFTEERLRLGTIADANGRRSQQHLQHAEHPGVSDKLPATDVSPLPAPDTWANVHELGVVGDGLHDDTAALQHAVDTHASLFFPAGRYRLTGTLHLRLETALIGLHPFATQIILADNTPAFQGAGAPVPVLETQPESRNIISGIGLSTGAFNPRANALLWRSGAASLLEDVKFFGGRGTLDEANHPIHIYPAPTPEPPVSQGWSTQAPSLIVRGGGGVFRAIWSASSFAQAGIQVESSAIPGAVYQFSCEHHLHHEVMLDGVSHWRFFALQTEEEAQQGKDAVALTLHNVNDLRIANLFDYRVTRSLGPADHAIEITGHNSGELVDLHVFGGGRYAFDNSVFDQRSSVRSRLRELALLNLSLLNTDTPLVPSTLLQSPMLFVPGSLHLVAHGFADLTGLTSLPDGDLLFTDASSHKLLRLHASSGQVEELKLPEDVKPVVIATITPAGAVVLDAAGKAYRISLTEPLTATALAPTAAGDARWLPTGGHSGWKALLASVHAEQGFPTAETSTVPTPKDMRPLLYGTQYSLYRKGTRTLLVSEEDAQVARLPIGGETPETIAPIAGTSVLELGCGRLLVAGDQLHLLSSEGRLLGTTELPSRPTSLLLADDQKTVWIGARGDLYSALLAPCPAVR